MSNFHSCHMCHLAYGRKHQQHQLFDKHGQSLHPMENPEILSNIFSYLTNLNDLRSVRLVCRLWRDISLDDWRRKGRLRLMWNDDTMAPCRSCQRASRFCEGPLDLSTFLELVKASERKGSSCPYQLATKPYSRYKVSLCKLIQSRLSEEEDMLEKFLSKCGPHARELQLDHCSSAHLSQKLAKLSIN